MLTRISVEEAENFIPLKEDFTGTTVAECPYFTSEIKDDGWDYITYYTARKRNPYRERGEGKYWIYILSNRSMPNLYKIGYTHNTPEERAKQVSASTGVVYPFDVEYAFKCHDGMMLEKEIHRYLDIYRVNNNREFFQVDLEEAIQTIEFLGKTYK
jgi:hypothetical protein